MREGGSGRMHDHRGHHFRQCRHWNTPKDSV
jgi:hypothetical protein